VSWVKMPSDLGRCNAAVDPGNDGAAGKRGTKVESRPGPRC
jgi:hypothetical protein